MAKHRQKAKYSKVVIGICLTVTIAFIVCEMVYLWFGKPLDTTLTLCTFGCFGIEYASLAAIKCSDNKHGISADAAAKAMPKVVIEETEETE